MNWARKKVLITGGAGFIGSCIASRLLEENAQIEILDNFSIGKMENVPEGANVIRGDVCDKNLLRKIDDVDYIFHFGAPSSSFLFRKNPKECITSTIYGFMNILELSKSIGVKKLVYPSSGTVYGNAPIPQSETDMPQPLTSYAVCKLACEHLARIYSNDVPSIGLRIFTGYGPQETHKKGFMSVPTQFIHAIIQGKRPIIYGDGTQSRDFVYINDIVKAAVRAAEISFSGILNVGSGRAVTFNELVQYINFLLNKDIKPIYKKIPKRYVMNTLADIKRMKELMGINPVDIHTGLKEYFIKLKSIKGSNV